MLLFSLFHIISAQAETIAEYHTSVYGVELFHQIKKGFIYANINENKSIVFDWYTSDVTTQKIVFNIKNKNVTQVEK